jgi:diguanylate cyclase (GGDEF)-like protein
VRRADRVEAESQLNPLTGRYNRRGWGTLLERAEARCRRHGSTGAVVAVDLDELKQVNDSQCHAAAARCLLQIVRSTDVVARVGGDAFQLLQVEAAGADAGRPVERLRANFAREGIQASVGFAVRGPGHHMHAAVCAADAAMYAEKRTLKAHG